METEKAIAAPLRNRQLVNRLMESTDMLQPPNLITTDQLANLMQVTGRTIRNWRTEGLIPYVKIRHLVFFEMSDVLELISSNKKQ